ncbi:winged helix-turn-helix domain-containing protein [Sulfitobacter sp. JB4-11]|uniref:winged helix-turn-helix domain-containing protein n=1 Tax=Sulfitobacter rhodophyticola TaxID=3238304 RepID=UPI003513E416
MLQFECQVVTETDNAFVDVEPYFATVPDVFFVYADPHNQSALSQVSVARNKGLPTLVIAVLKDLPSLGAQMYEAGAADVVHWPTDLKEIALRLRHHLCHMWDSSSTIDLSTDWEAESFVADIADLTTAEAQIVRILMANDGRIVTRDDLSLALDARPWRHGDRKFDVHMASIRKKLLAAFGSNLTVSTIRSRGYRLSTNGSDLFASVDD